MFGYGYGHWLALAGGYYSLYWFAAVYSVV